MEGDDTTVSKCGNLQWKGRRRSTCAAALPDGRDEAGLLPASFPPLSSCVRTPALVASLFDERQELLARLGLIAEAAEHGRRDRRRPGLLDAAHRHAHVPIRRQEAPVSRKAKKEVSKSASGRQTPRTRPP
jgi:hypothetical protein